MSDRLHADAFPEFFEALWGYAPFPWQTELAAGVAHHDTWPDELPLPTGAGKTAALDIALFHLALQAVDPATRTAPCRIVLVVDRRIVVDGAYRRARALRDKLRTADMPILRAAAQRLAALGACDDDPLRVARLRGGVPFEPDWVRTPSQPAMVISTVDQVGSRLLFRGYGVSPRMWPVHAGLLGRDTLFLIDEAHLSQPFRDTLGMLRGQMSAPGETPPRPVFMSATPASPKRNRLTEADRSHPALGPRLRAAKPARLVDAGPLHEPTGAPNPEFVTRMADIAWTLSPLGREGKRRKLSPAPEAADARAIAVVVNRVGVARSVRDQLADYIQKTGADARVLLRIGRTRPLDREAQQVANQSLMSGRERNDEVPVTFVVATQSIEVGADLDLDALVTQAAPLDSLRQRFGRLDRLGHRGISSAVIVAPKEDQKQPDKADDPVYGGATAATWQWLGAQAKDNVVDFGIDHLALPDAETLGPLIAPRHPAPVIFPAYVAKWRKTSPPPAAEPAPRLFLHGPESAPADVTLVWRADLPAKGLTDAHAQAVLAPLSPTAPEGLSVPVGAARAWLTRRTAPLADVEGARPDDREASTEGAFERWPIRWASGDATVIGPRELRPGDTLVMPAAWGGCDDDGWAPDSDRMVADLAETAALRQRRQLVLRLTRARLEAVGTDLWPMDREATWAGITRVLDDPPADRSDFLAALRAVEPLPVFWRQRLDMLAESGVGLGQPLYPYTETGAILTAKRRLSADQLRELGVLDAEDAADVPATEHDTGALTGAVNLADHSIAVSSAARELAEKAGYNAAIAADIALAGRLHDLGKAEARFQILLHGGDELAALAGTPRAKGDPMPAEALAQARSASALPAGTRHEAWSVALAERHPDLAQAHDSDLVCWLVGTHHGHGRPMFPATGDTVEGEVSVVDPETGADLTAPVRHGLERLDSGWSARLRRLETRYGVWGLAHLEAVLRLADHRVSEGVLPRHRGTS